MRKIIISSFLSIMTLNMVAQENDDFSFDNFNFYKDKHIGIIKEKCIKIENPKECMISDIKSFYLGLKILKEPHGKKYYKKCYDKNSNNGVYDYVAINNCTTNYNNILSYNFMGKEYNHMFLEEGYIMNNITQTCTSSYQDFIDLDAINNCINKQRKSFKFFKLNFFNNSSKSVESIFYNCIKKYEYGNYSFDYTSINSCIKKNTYNFK